MSMSMSMSKLIPELRTKCFHINLKDHKSCSVTVVKYDVPDVHALFSMFLLSFSRVWDIPNKMRTPPH